ncbi:Synaptobrevin [Portunus trituberculatus]|uniref:Synaptobrevin n=1 Tax=Portunus trituberculatus TaxID=210409 RepID=A0A5B7DD96_PORTR|nr:Synaptobrevin [Portunus trituberculatus]
MKTNVENIMVRDKELHELDRCADSLRTSSMDFQVTSRKLKKKYWWKNLKMMLILGGVVVFIIAIILIIVFTDNDGSSGDSGSSGGSVTDSPTTNVPGVVLVLLASAASAARPHLYQPPPQQYDFGYGVSVPHTGDAKEHKETVSQTGRTEGEYRWLQPNGLYRPTAQHLKGLVDKVLNRSLSHKVSKSLTVSAPNTSKSLTIKSLKVPIITSLTVLRDLIAMVLTDKVIKESILISHIAFRSLAIKSLNYPAINSLSIRNLAVPRDLIPEVLK